MPASVKHMCPVYLKQVQLKHQSLMNLSVHQLFSCLCWAQTCRWSNLTVKNSEEEKLIYLSHCIWCFFWWSYYKIPKNTKIDFYLLPRRGNVQCLLFWILKPDSCAFMCMYLLQRRHDQRAESVELEMILHSSGYAQSNTDLCTSVPSAKKGFVIYSESSHFEAAIFLLLSISSPRCSQCILKVLYMWWCTRRPHLHFPFSSLGRMHRLCSLYSLIRFLSHISLSTAE